MTHASQKKPAARVKPERRAASTEPPVLTANLLVPHLPDGAELTWEQYRAGDWPPIKPKRDLELFEQLEGDTEAKLRALTPFMRADQFRETGNPVCAIESLLAAHDLGCYPTMGVLAWLHAGLKEWHREQGTRSLDAILGLKKGRGSKQIDQSFAELLRHDRDMMLANDMAHLTAWGASVRDAAALVAARLEDADWNRTRYDIGDLSARTIEDRWRADWQHRFESSRDILERASTERRLRFMGQFPHVPKHWARAMRAMGLHA